METKAMKIKYQEKEYSNMSGSALLRQIQNQHTPTIDLFIRESVQNSLDAARTDVDAVRVEIYTGMFRSEKLSPFFEDIEEELKELYPDECKFLSITDKGTKGLTGPISLSEVHGENYGNLQSLIYQIAKPQSKKGAGGSWGIGKTVYFRAGNGLVIYYSRIFNEKKGHYEERLAAAAVEDEKSPALLRKNPHRTGMAWWGQKDPFRTDRDWTIPLVDSEEIHQILDVFDLEPMTGDETGTTVIIPYINPEALLQQTITETEQAEEVPTPYWKNDLLDCLSVCLQKWYCPRLDNPHYRQIGNGPYLKASVNNRLLVKESFLPLFQLMQKLYNSSPEKPERFEGRQIESEDISLRNEFDSSTGKTSAGILSCIRVDEDDMRMELPEHLPSPYACIDKDSPVEMNEPILAYTRRPGMIVSYETDSEWTHSTAKTEHGEFIIALFRSSRDTRLHPDLRKDDRQTLEDYLRETENADHMSWQDLKSDLKKKGNIVKKIRRNISRKIRDRYKEVKQNAGSRKNLGLGKRVGSKILPPEGSSYWDQRSGGTSGPGGTGGSGDFPSGGASAGAAGSRGFGMMQTGVTEFVNNQLHIPVLLTLGKEKRGNLIVRVKTETGLRDAKYWKKNLNADLPVWIDALEIHRIDKGQLRRGRKKTKSWKQISETSVIDDVEFEFVSSPAGKDCHSVRISVPEADNYRIELTAVITVGQFEGDLAFSKESDNKKDKKDKKEAGV